MFGKQENSFYVRKALEQSVSGLGRDARFSKEVVEQKRY